MIFNFVSCVGETMEEEQLNARSRKSVQSFASFLLQATAFDSATAADDDALQNKDLTSTLNPRHYSLRPKPKSLNSCK